MFSYYAAKNEGAIFNLPELSDPYEDTDYTFGTYYSLSNTPQGADYPQPATSFSELTTYQNIRQSRSDSPRAGCRSACLGRGLCANSLRSEANVLQVIRVTNDTLSPPLGLTETYRRRRPLRLQCSPVSLATP
jgi:hypothetical protein